MTMLPRSGPRRARRWYWSQAIRSAWPALTLDLRPSTVPRFAAGVALGLLALWVVSGALVAIASAGVGALWSNGAAPMALIEAVYLAGMVPASIVAGYAAAWQGGRTGGLAALTLATLLLVPAALLALGHLEGWSWAHAAWFVAGPLGVVTGARRCARRSPAW